LHSKAGACTIGIAYRAAEANHPGKGREGSPLTKILRKKGPAIQAEERRIL
jgi:hypothetical protein